MAEPLTPPGEGPEDQYLRSPTRQALEATLAEALRDVETGADQADAEEPSPAEARPAGARRVNPFNRGLTATLDQPQAHGPAEAAAPSRLSVPGFPKAGSGRSGQPGQSGQSGTSGQPGQSGPARLPSPTLLGGAAVSALRSPGLSELGASRTVSNLAPAPEALPAEPATIALRRPRRSEPEQAPPAEAPAAAHPSTLRQAAPIPAWSPADDDILPRVSLKRRSFRRRR